MIPAEPATPAAAPQTEAEKIAAARELLKQADAAADPNSGKAWLLNEGVMGAGEKPAWFKSDKYKTVAAQAEAYTHLESRFGSFTGAPKNDKGEVNYSFTPPDGFNLNGEHPLMQSFVKWAGDNQLSQEGYTQVMSQLLQYEQANAPKMPNVIARLGENADQRISNTAAWAKANLGAEGFALLRDAVSTQGPTQEQRIAATFKLVETLIGKTGQVRMPKVGNDVPASGGGDGLKAIQDAMGVRDANGKLRIHNDSKYRMEIDKRFQNYYANAQA